MWLGPQTSLSSAYFFWVACLSSYVVAVAQTVLPPVFESGFIWSAFLLYYLIRMLLLVVVFPCLLPGKIWWSHCVYFLFLLSSTQTGWSQTARELWFFVLENLLEVLVGNCTFFHFWNFFFLFLGGGFQKTKERKCVWWYFEIMKTTFYKGLDSL